MSEDERYLIAPGLLIGILRNDAKANAFTQKIDSSKLVISHLTLAIVRSLIVSSSTLNAIQKDSWEKTLNQVVANLCQFGALMVDVGEPVLNCFHLYRLHEPLQYLNEKNEPTSVGQDTRLLIATADAFGFTLTDYDSPYLHQLKKGTSVRTLVI